MKGSEVNQIQGDNLTKDQIITLVACMLSIANVDGLRPEELALIETFYAESGGQDLPPFTSFSAESLKEQQTALAAGNGDQFSERVILMCLMTGYADGSLSADELAHVNIIARSAGVSEERVAALQVQVKDSLLGSLAHLPDSESVAALARTL